MHNMNIKNFYNYINFNQFGLKKEINLIKNINVIKDIPILKDINYEYKILELGSGSGWLLNGLSYYYNAFGVGIDFNKNGINVSNKVSKKLKLNTFFIENDISSFSKYKNEKFKTIISFGVLHHIKNFEEVLEDIVTNLLDENGILILGLYNKYERYPFLEHFQKLKNKNYSNKKLFKCFKNLIFKNKNNKIIKSIFYDQVLTPFESQYSFIEIENLLNKLGCTILQTSLNNYEFIDDSINFNKIENELLLKAKIDISKNIFNPGLFTIKAIKNN